MQKFSSQQYEYYRAILRGQKLPLAFIDLDAFDANVEMVKGLVAGSGRKIRLGSKSIRCEPLMKRIFELGGDDFQGLLTFTAEESAWLAEKGHDNMIIAYPSIQDSDLRLLVKMTRAGKRVSMVVDSLEQLRRMSAFGSRAGIKLCACVEADMSYRPFGELGVHLGMRRSPLRMPQEVRKLVNAAHDHQGVKINSFMGYEGHIAGINDDIPGQRLKNTFLKILKSRSVDELTARRGKIVTTLREAGVPLEIVNGGGSGSLVSTLADPAVTEVTVGSGFYCSALFHHYREIHYQPAAFFAIQIVRRPEEGMVTCLGGGYVASGAVGWDKSPKPVLPTGLKLVPLEGTGEVQTPLELPQNCPHLELGDPVIFQHAKAGELCERFNELILIKEGDIVGTVPTYRGEGKTFL